MKNLGYYNGKYDEIENMQIPMLDRVCWYGDGIAVGGKAPEMLKNIQDALVADFEEQCRA